MQRRLSVCLIMLCASAGSSQALACRCAERGLADHYAMAEQVFLAQVVALEAVPDSAALRLRLELQEAPFKGSAAAGEYRTGASSASCGVAARVGQTLLVFAAGEENGITWLSSCNGTRLLNPDAAQASGSYPDAEAQEVLPRLRAWRAQRNAVQAQEAVADVADSSKPLTSPGRPLQHSVRGLLAVPSLLEQDFSAAAAGAAGVIPLVVHCAPDAAAAVIAQLHQGAPLRTREYGYERSGALVYEVVDGWYRIGLLRAGETVYGWVAHRDEMQYRPLPGLLRDGLAYLSSGWDGMVWPGAGAGLPLRSRLKDSHGREEYPARILGGALVADSVWLQVELFDGSECDGPERPRVIHRGWIPLWNASGETTAWFWSRGC